MRTGSEAIAPRIAARWEIDLSAGARTSPTSAPAGSKRMFTAISSRPRNREAEVADQLPCALCVLLAADPQRDDALVIVLGRGKRHIDDVDTCAPERERYLGDDAGAVWDRRAKLVDWLPPGPACKTA